MTDIDVLVLVLVFSLVWALRVGGPAVREGRR